VLAIVACAGLSGSAVTAWAQSGPEIVDAADISAIIEATEPVADADSVEPSGIDLLSLIIRGGGFMIPIAIMSMLVVSLAVERLLAMRRRKVIPQRLKRELLRLSDAPNFDPESAFEACRVNHSATANVVRSMLLRTGQPLGEIERTAGEAAQREADQYAGPIRWLNLAAAATPLMGLLGTVWGMIVAFHQSSTLSANRSRSEQLSEGIYTALVTTLAGLIVAIPAAILAQYLENRVTKLFHQIELLAFDIAPGLSRFTGQQRLTTAGKLVQIDSTDPPMIETDDPPVPAADTQRTAHAPPPVSADDGRPSTSRAARSEAG